MTDIFRFANFVATELEEGISVGATEIAIPLSASEALPVVGADIGVEDEIRLVLWDGQQDPEIVGVVLNNQTGLLTVVRAREDTTAKAWAAGTQVRCVLTAEIINTALAAYFDIGTVLSANFLKLTGGTLTGPLTLSGPPTSGLHAVTKSYADGLLGGVLPSSGGTMTGPINMGGNQILSLGAPTSAGAATRKSYVDGLFTELQGQVAAGFSIYTTEGTGSAYTVTTSGGDLEPSDGTALSIRMHATNEGDATLNVDEDGAAAIQIAPGEGLPPGALVEDITYTIVFDGTAWIVTGVLGALVALVTADEGAAFLADGDGGGAWQELPSVLLDRGTITTQASFDFDISEYTGYREIEISLTGLVASSNVSLFARLSADGSTFPTANWFWIWQASEASGSNTQDNNTSGSNIVLSPSLEIASEDSAEFKISITGHGDASKSAFITWTGTISDNGYPKTFNGAGGIGGAQVTEAIRVLVPAGTFSASYAVVGKL